MSSALLLCILLLVCSRFCCAVESADMGMLRRNFSCKFYVDFKFHSVEKMLIKKLLENYEKVGKIGRPVRNTSSVLKVEFGLSLFQLMDLDEASQLLTVNVWNKFVSLILVIVFVPRCIMLEI